MFKNQSVIYSPYGAYELKATYQRNMVYSNMLVLCIIFIIVSLLIIFGRETHEILAKGKPAILIDMEILPMPPISDKPPQVKVRPPKSDRRAVEQLIPLDDDELIEDESEIVSIEDYAKESDLQEGQAVGNDIGNITIEDDGLMLGLDVFVPVEQRPEFIIKASPNYPRFEKMADIEGTVWIAVEVDVDGSVIHAKVYRTSGRESFDQAALEVAFKNTFRPAIQNGNPIKLWVAYEVEFILIE